MTAYHDTWIRKRGNILAFLAPVVAIVWGRFRRQRATARTAFSDHGLTITGLGFISGASFVHSLFTGLLVTGLLVLLFEIKVSE